MSTTFEDINSQDDVILQEDLNSFVFSGSIALGAGAILTPAVLTTNQDDYDPTGFRVSGEIVKSVILQDATSNVDITGLVPSTTATVNIVTITNVSTTSKKIKLKNLGGGSLVANRFLFKADITIQANGSYTVYYDTAATMWRPYTDPQ